MVLKGGRVSGDLKIDPKRHQESIRNDFEEDKTTREKSIPPEARKDTAVTIT